VYSRDIKSGVGREEGTEMATCRGCGADGLHYSAVYAGTHCEAAAQIKAAGSQQSQPAAPVTVLITGNTFPVKEQLKALGGRWDAAARGWRVPADRADEARRLVGRPDVTPIEPVPVERVRFPELRHASGHAREFYEPESWHS
jgi:hypothetical protein